MIAVVLYRYVVAAVFAACLLRWVQAQENAEDCLALGFEGAVRSGQWDCASLVASQSSGSTGGVDLLEVFNAEQRAISQKLTGLKSIIEALRPMKVIVPALQWAESTEYVFLNVKFAHIISAPATLNVEVSNVTLREKSMYLEATDGKKLFRLELDFLREIDKDSSSYAMASVGRMTFQIKKADAPSHWKKGLITSRGQSTIWYEKQEQHSSALEKLAEDEVTDKDAKKAGDDDDDDDDDDEESSGPKAKGQAKKAKKAKKAKAKGETKGKGKKSEPEAETEAEEEGKIVTPDEQEVKDREKATNEAVADLERDAKKRKRDLKYELVEKEKSIDKETAEKTKQLREELKAFKAAKASSSSASSAAATATVTKTEL